MDDTREMVRVNSRVALEPRDKTEAWGLAKIAVESGFFAVKTPAEALIILMTGRELGLTAMQSLRGIYVVKGRPMVSADAMVACVQADPRCEYWQPVESTPDRCVIRTKRRGVPEPVTGVFTTDDAKAAGLLSNEMYRKYPRVMLRHRCAAELVREVYSDVILGIYCEGEIDGHDPRGMVTVPREEYQPDDAADLPALLPPPLPPPTDLEAFRSCFSALVTREDAAQLWVDWRDRLRAESADITGWGDLADLFPRRGWKALPHARGWLKRASAEIAARTTPPDDPQPSGPNGGARRPSGATSTDASGSAQESHGGDGASASVTTLPHVPEWATTPGGIRAHLGSLDHVRHLENSARLHGARLGAAYTEPAAERLIALDGPDAHGSHLALSTARGMVAAWAEAGPRPKAEPRRAGGAR